MIEYIKGELVDATPAWVVVECNGLGYGINVSLNTYSAVQGKRRSNSIYMRPSVKMRMCYTDLLPVRRGNCFVAYQRIGHWRKYSTYDFVGTFSFGIV